MKIKKLINYLLSFLTICFLFIIILYNKEISNVIYESISLWYYLIIPSILPTYFIGNFLIINNNIFNIIYYLTNKIFHFENKYSCLLFFISFVISNPSITFLIKENYEKNTISLNEANKLMRCTNHFSIIYIIKIIDFLYIPLILIALYSSSILIFIFSNNNIQTNIELKKTNIDLFKLFDDSYLLLLKILVIMIFINIISFILVKSFKTPKLITIFFEITQGINTLNKLNFSQFYYHLYSLILLSFGGFSLIIQIIIINKKTMDIRNFFLYRIVHLILTILIYFCLFKFFN